MLIEKEPASAESGADDLRAQPTTVAAGRLARRMAPRRPDIIWDDHQRSHIEAVHHVFQDEFEQAWFEREPQDDERRPDGRTEGFGLTNAGRQLVMVWELQDGDVFPITAFEPDSLRYTDAEGQSTEESAKKRPKRKRRRKKGR